jgi:hypothetical protein
MAAYFLQKYADRPLAITLFEADSRIGGKVHTQKFSSTDITYEVGAAELYDYSRNGCDSLRDLVAELGLPTQPMEGWGVVIDGKWIGNLSDFRTAFGDRELQNFIEFHRRAQDQISPHEFYAADHPEGLPTHFANSPFVPFLDRFASPVVRRYIQTLIHSDLATEPRLTSTTYGLQNYLMNDSKYMQLYCIEGGNERLVHELAGRIDVETRLNCKVETVFKTESGAIAVESISSDQRDLDEFDYVIVALPHNHLNSVVYSSDRLANAVRKHFEYYNHPAHYLRMTLLFEKPFWRHWMKESYCMLDHFDGCCLYDESLRQPGITQGILGWLVGGDAAERMSHWSDEKLLEAALDSLPQELAHGKQLLKECVIKRWIKAVSALPGGNNPPPLHARHCPEPVEHSHLFFIGDYLFDSTLNGVLDSAEYVAGWIAANLMLPVVTPTNISTPPFSNVHNSLQKTTKEVLHVNQ